MAARRFIGPKRLKHLEQAGRIGCNGGPNAHAIREVGHEGRKLYRLALPPAALRP